MYGAAPNVVVFTTNGFPTFKQALTLLDRMGHKDLLVVPLALIGSTHLMDYLGGDVLIPFMHCSLKKGTM